MNIHLKGIGQEQRAHQQNRLINNNGYPFFSTKRITGQVITTTQNAAAAERGGNML